MNSANVKRSAYRIPPSKYWAQYWYSRQVGAIASVQLLMAFGIVSMEIGNAVVDIFRSNVYTGFWSFPFMILAILATYACVCATRTQTKAIVALIFQLISIIVILLVIGFLIAFIVTNFTLCLGIQCSQSSSTNFSSSTYLNLKRAFISCELICSVIYVILSILYIYYFIKCYKKLPRIHPVVRSVTAHSIIQTRQLSSLSKTSRIHSMSTVISNRINLNEQKRITSSSTTATTSYVGAQKICPNCTHISPYIPSGNIVECPKCGYQSPLVEHAQQW